MEEGLWGIAGMIRVWGFYVDLLGTRLAVALLIGLPIAAAMIILTLAILF